MLQVCRELSGPEQEILMRLIKEEIQNRYDVYRHPETNERVFRPLVEQDEEEPMEEDYIQILNKRVQISSNIEFMPILDD